MIKDVVVHVRTDQQEDFAGDYAVFMADTLKAHLTAIAFAYEPIDLVSHLGYIAKEVMKEQWRDFKNEAQLALDRLGKIASTAEILFEPVSVSASFAGASDQFGRIARRFDLTVVGQPELGRSSIGGDNHRKRAIRFRPASNYCSLRPKSGAQAQPRHDLLGWKPRCSTGHCGRNATP